MACDWFRSGRKRHQEKAKPVPPPVSNPQRLPLIRVTTEHDGTILPRMMSDRANAFVRDGSAFVFCGTSIGPWFFQVELASRRVDRLDPLLPYGGETEGWYWTPTGRIVLPYGPQLLSVDPFNSGDVETLIDLRDRYPRHDLWQPHSSDDGLTHSATVRKEVDDGRFPYVGTVIQSPRGQRFEEAIGLLDESQVTRDGSFVVIKEHGDDNRIIDLVSGEVWDLPDADGAIGHSDCGQGFIIGESNLPGPGRCVKLDLATRGRTTLFETDNMGYISYRGGVCLNSDDTHLNLVSILGGGRTPILAHGATNIRNADGSYNYDNRPKANLDPTGRIACFMSNMGTDRQDVYLLELQT